MNLRRRRFIVNRRQRPPRCGTERSAAALRPRPGAPLGLSRRSAPRAWRASPSSSSATITERRKQGCVASWLAGIAVSARRRGLPRVTIRDGMQPKLECQASASAILCSTSQQLFIRHPMLVAAVDDDVVFVPRPQKENRHEDHRISPHRPLSSGRHRRLGRCAGCKDLL